MERRSFDFREEKLFLWAYSFWLIDAIVGITMWSDFETINALSNYLQRIAYLLFVLQFLLKKFYTKKDIAGIGMFLIINILACHAVYNKYIIATAIMVYLSANVEFKKILRCTLIIQAAFMVITILASQMNVIENVIWEESGARIRESLGYDYCAYPAHLFLFLTLMWFCLRKKAYTGECLLLLLVNYIVFRLTDSRADYYLTIIGTVGFYGCSRVQKRKIIKKIGTYLMKYGCFILALISILLQLFYKSENSVMFHLNVALSNRLSLGYDAIHEYGFSLFGRVIRWIGKGSVRANDSLIYNYVDCSFLKEFLTFGLCFLLLLIVAFYMLGKRIVIEEDFILGWAIVVSLLYSALNAHLCMVVFNVFILKLGIIFSNNSDERAKIEYFRNKYRM